MTKNSLPEIVGLKTVPRCPDCGNMINDPICEGCMASHVISWLKRKRGISAATRVSETLYDEISLQSTGKEFVCKHCKKNEVTICPSCFLNKFLLLAKENHAL